MTQFRKQVLDWVEEIGFDESGSGFGNLVGRTEFETRWVGLMNGPV